MQERFIPILEKRENQRFEDLKKRVRADLQQLKNVDHQALVAEFDRTQFENLLGNSSFYNPNISDSMMERVQEQLVKIAKGYDRAFKGIKENYEPPKA